MNKITAYDGNTRFERVSKAKAKQLFDAGKPVVFCPVNLYPFGGFRPSCTIDNTMYGSIRDFAWVVKEFEWFNCTDKDAGKYTAFYVNSQFLKEANK